MSEREIEDQKYPKDTINSLRIPLTFKRETLIKQEEINYVPPQCDLKSSQQSPSFRHA